MLIAVIGGKLQGLEVVYLAQKAGWKTIVIDKNPHAPAALLCDQFLEFEFTLEHPMPLNFPAVDIIFPAIEDVEVLTSVKIWAEMKNIPLAFDLNAYKISNSKLDSDALFKKMNFPTPKPWPDCQFPIVIKPDQESGSQGVEVFNNSKAFNARFPNRLSLINMVIQQYLEGPSYSIEVAGHPGKYQALYVTDLVMDKIYDCKSVTAPTKLSWDQIKIFKEMAIAIAQELHLTGIMDVEVILNNSELKLLEIDARFPSQTPLTVYWATGINMVEILVNLFLNKKYVGCEQKYEHFVVVEHIRVSGADIEVCGEHIMAQQGHLTLRSDFFGASEAITSFVPCNGFKGQKLWVATLIFAGNSHEDVTIKRNNCHEQIRQATISYQF